MFILPYLTGSLAKGDKHMKRLLCTLLSITMLISLLPAVSFAVDTRETQIYSFAKADYSGVADPSGITYTNSSNKLGCIGTNQTTGTIYSWSANYACININSGNFVAYKINIPASGKYTLTFDWICRAAGTVADMYIIPGALTVEAIPTALTSAEEVLTYIDFHSSTDKERKNKTTSFTANTTGDYTVIWVGKDSTNGKAVRPVSITLTPVKTAEYKDVTHSLYATELVGKEIGFTAQINTTDGIFVPEKTGDGLAVTTDNDDVAEIIDATYKDGIYSAKLKTKATGVVNINFTATVDGNKYPSSFEIEVTEMPEPYEISVSFDKDAWSGLANPSGITYANSNRIIEWIGTSSTNGTQNGWSGDHSFFNLGKGKYAAYQMYLPAEGKYTLTLDYVQNDSNGAVADVYLIPGLKKDIAAATASATPVFENVNCRNELIPGTVSTDTRFDITEGGAYTLVFMSRNNTGGYAVRIEKLTLTPYIPPEYDKTEISLHDTEVAGRDIPFTVMAVMSDGKNFVPELTGDGIDVSLQATDKAEIIDATYEDGVYSAKLRTLATGDIALDITTTVNGIAHPHQHSVSLIEQPALSPITIEMTKSTMVFGDQTAPSEDWQTDGFSLVLDPLKMTSAKSRYTDRVIKFANGSSKTLVQLVTGNKIWPELANSMFTISKRIFTPGNYKIEMTGIMLNESADYSIYVNGEYAGDFVFHDSAALSGGNEGAEGKVYRRSETLNTIYLPYGDVEISFRARRLNGSSAFFVPYTVTLNPSEYQEELRPVKIETTMSAMLPVNESEEVSGRVLMSDGSYRLFGPANDGKNDASNGVYMIYTEVDGAVDNSVAEISNPIAPKFVEADTFKFTVNGKSIGKADVKIVVKVDGEEYTETLPIEIIEKPTLHSVELEFDKEKLPMTRSAKTTLSLTRSTDYKEYAYDKSVVYRSASEEIATVDEDGVITGISEGTTTIYADVTDWDGSVVTGEKEIVITSAPTLYEIKGSYATELVTGNTDEIKLEAVMNDGEPGDISKYQITYESSNEAVATVTNGLVAAEGAGETIISITAEGENGRLCSVVYKLTVYDEIDPIVIDFSKTATKLDYSLPDTTPGYTVLTDIAKPTQYRMFDCDGRDMLQIRTGSTLWPAGGDVSKSAFAFSFEARSSGYYSLDIFGGIYRSCAVYSVYINGTYAGDYNFSDPSGIATRRAGEEKTLNTVYLEKGTNEVTFLLRELPVVAADGKEYKGSYLILRSLTFTPTEKSFEFVEIKTEIPRENLSDDVVKLAVGEEIDIAAYAYMDDGSLYAFGPSYEGSLIDEKNNITITDEKGKVSVVSTTDILNDGKNNFILKGENAGETVLVLNAVIDGKNYTKEISVIVMADPLVSTAVVAEAEELYAGDMSYLIAKPGLASGRILSASAAVSSFKSLDEDIATVEDNLLVTHKSGTARIEVTTTFNGVTETGVSEFDVKEAGLSSVTITAGGSETIRLTDKGLTDTVPLKVFAYDNVGNEINLKDAKITATESSETVELDDDLNIYPVSEGEAEFDVTVKLSNGRIRQVSAKLRVVYGKSKATYFTEEEAINARENYKQYDWVKSEYASYITNADFYIEHLDTLYDMIPSQGVPRAICVGNYDDPYTYTCRYCGCDIMAKYGQFSWQHNPLARPWKSQCPDCKRLFPSNDFGSFYKLGLNEYGEFDRQRALEAHREMLLEKGLIDTSVTAPGEVWSASWLKYYGYGVKGGYLYNELYENDNLKEVKTLNGGQGLRPGETQETWGVDDGQGYAPHDENGKPYSYMLDGEVLIERHTYIAVYNHFGLWRKHGDDKGRAGVIRNAIRYCSYAYFLTGDVKYGRVAAILLDRVADFYPDYDIAFWNEDFEYGNTEGGLDTGNIVGCIWECEEIVHIMKAYDMVYDMYEDEFVLEYLKNKSESIRMKHTKNSASQIRTNIEDGILRPALESLVDCSVSGNFGLPQEANAVAAVVLDSMPETAEWLDYLYAPGWVRKNYMECLGGSVDEVLMDDIDADGQGWEGSQYNNGWHGALIEIQEILEDYDRYETASLWNYPKFCQMFYSRIPLITGYYTPQLGDSGSTASKDIWMTSDVAKTGWKHFRDPVFAQILYMFNGNSSDGLHYDFTEKNPERLETEVQAVIDEYGEFTQISEAMTNFGFAVLRAGTDYKSAAASTEKNTGRDIWMYSGSSTGHGHLDTLNLGMRAFGLNFLPDLGYPRLTGSDPERVQWTETTLSHNTVMVDELAQKDYTEPRGELLHFDDDGKVALMDVSAPYVYDATDEYRRSVVMIEADDDVSYAVDFFRVLGGDKHTYSFHASSNSISETSGLSLIPQTDANGNYVGTYAGTDVPFGRDPGSDSGVVQYPLGYTWLKNIERDESPENEFMIDFNIKDFNKAIKDSSNLHLRLTMLNSSNLEKGAETKVAITDGYPPTKEENKNIDKLKYVLVENSGTNLDTVFTSVLQPYRLTPYIKSATELTMQITDGKEKSDDAHRAVRVEHTNGRVDYIFWSTNSAVTYSIMDETNGVPQNLSFRGFVGVYTVNENGACIYRTVHDGDIIGTEINMKHEITGVVKSFTKEPSENNEIRILPSKVPTEQELANLANKYVVIDNGDGNRGGTYKIEKATMQGSELCLDIGRITPIRKYFDSHNPDKGYVYLLENGQPARITYNCSENPAPVFDDIPQNISVSAGSSITVDVNAESPVEVDTPIITYIGTTLPRGASINSETGVVTWKPDSSQVGDNHVAVTARDSDGRESTVHFYITVYGSTTGGSEKEETETPSTGTTDAPAGGGGGGGGGGGTTPTDKPETGDDQTGETSPDASGETDNGDDTTQPGVGDGGSDVPQFTDLGNHSWAADAINSLASDGIIRGTTETTFSPANNITRADFALLLVRAFNLTSDDTENFADVTASDYFASELAIARNTGIVNGIGDNKFAPRNTITRQDMMVIVYRALTALEKMPSLPKGGGTAERRWEDSDGGGISPSQYPDYTTVASYARDAVSALISEDIVNGKSGLIAPADYTTRAEVAVLIKRILDYKASLA